MGKTTAVAKRHFGRRFSQLLGEAKRRGLIRSRKDLADRAHVAYSTLRNWKTYETPPRGDKERIHRVEAILGEKLWDWGDSGEGEPMRRRIINEARTPYQSEPERYVQPLDFKKEALDACGRARHYLSVLKRRLKSGEKIGVAEMVRLLKQADSEVSDAQSQLMGEITINDRGEKM